MEWWVTVGGVGLTRSQHTLPQRLTNRTESMHGQRLQRQVCHRNQSVWIEENILTFFSSKHGRILNKPSRHRPSGPQGVAEQPQRDTKWLQIDTKWVFSNGIYSEVLIRRRIVEKEHRVLLTGLWGYKISQREIGSPNYQEVLAEVVVLAQRQNHLAGEINRN